MSGRGAPLAPQRARDPLPGEPGDTGAGAVCRARWLTRWGARQRRDYAQQAFERRYVDDHSWEQLEEDEQGRLRLVGSGAPAAHRPAAPLLPAAGAGCSPAPRAQLVTAPPLPPPPPPQDQTAEQRAKRKRLLSAAQTARIRKGLIRYVQLVRGGGGQPSPARPRCLLPAHPRSSKATCPPADPATWLPPRPRLSPHTTAPPHPRPAAGDRPLQRRVRPGHAPLAHGRHAGRLQGIRARVLRPEPAQPAGHHRHPRRHRAPADRPGGHARGAGARREGGGGVGPVLCRHSAGVALRAAC